MSDSFHTPEVTVRKQVMFFDTDCAGVVHNIAYLRFIEEARTLLAEDLGWKLAEMSSTGLYPVVVRTTIDYRRPAKLGDPLAVRGWLDAVERMRFHCAFELTSGNGATPHATCRQSLALVQAPEMRPVRLPADWRARFAHLIRPGKPR